MNHFQGKDPICGMSVDPNDSDDWDHQGKKYCFCCEGCREEFKKHPDDYLSESEQIPSHYCVVTGADNWI